MKVKELIELLQNCNMEAEVSINGNEDISAVWDCPLSEMVDITSVPQEEEVNNMERDEFFLALAEEIEQGESEVLDSMKINRVC
jgi:hypothetical protein